MKKLFFLLIVLSIANQCYAFDIVYPKKTNVTINAKSTFFIGSSKSPLKVNGSSVSIHPSGGFAYVVPLKEGQNTFVIESSDEKKVYTITKPVIKASYFMPVKFVQYNNTKSVYVTTERAPLRSTPVDAGINRMAHLQRNVLLNIDGEKGGFYRVVLGNEKYGWIAKTNVKPCENYINEPAVISGYEYSEDDKYFRYVFHLDKKVPFDIVEGNPLVLRLFNIKDDEIFTKEFEYDKLLGYSGEYIGNDFVWKIRKPFNINPKKPFKNRVIAIDAGHGGYEAGAIGCLGDKEKNITLAIAKYLQNELEKRGADVVMTRSDDSYVGLQERVDIANYNGAEVFVSIHGNALPDGLDPNEHSGTSIYYYYNQSKPLADVVINTITSELGLNNDKVRQASFAVVRNTNALSILIETAYLINPEDNSKLISEDFQKQYAKAVADGLEEYFKTKAGI